MYDFIRGTLNVKDINQITVEVNGIGYLIFITVPTYESLPELGAMVKIFTYFHLRENIQQLYGFATVEERHLFNLLLSVPDIGPRTAMSVLSHITPSNFRQAVKQGNLKFLSSIPGIGKKTAEKIVFTLKDNDSLMAGIESQRKDKFELELQDFDDALAGLVSLGYKETQARSILEQIIKSNATSTQLKAEQLITLALRHLSNTK